MKRSDKNNTRYRLANEKRVGRYNKVEYQIT